MAYKVYSCIFYIFLAFSGRIRISSGRKCFSDNFHHFRTWSISHEFSSEFNDNSLRMRDIMNLLLILSFYYINVLCENQNQFPTKFKALLNQELIEKAHSGEIMSYQ